MNDGEAERFFVDENSPIEKIMQAYLESSGLNYKTQYTVYEKGWASPKYILDFLVYGKTSRVVVECDGETYHAPLRRQRNDRIRDQWLLKNGYNAVLRFSTRQIKKEPLACIAEIRRSIENLDKGLSHAQKRISTVSNHVSTADVDVSKKTVALYCHGVAKSRVWGHGGAVVLLTYKDQEKEVSRSYSNTNTNRMTIRAIILGLESLTQACNVEIYLADAFAVNYGNEVFTKRLDTNFRGISTNRDLWLRVKELVIKHNVVFKLQLIEDNKQLRAVRSRARQIGLRTNPERIADMADELAPRPLNGK